MRNVIPI